MTRVLPQLFEAFIHQSAAASWLLSPSAGDGTNYANYPPSGMQIELCDPVPVVLSQGRSDVNLETKRTGAFLENGSNYVALPLFETGNILCGVLVGNIVSPSVTPRSVRMTKWAADVRYSVLFKTTWFVDGCFSMAVLRTQQPEVWIEETYLFDSVNSALLGDEAIEVVRLIDRRDCPACSQEKIVCEHSNLPTSLSGIFDGRVLEDYSRGLSPSSQFVTSFYSARLGQFFGYSETSKANILHRAFMRKFISPLSPDETNQGISDLSELDASWCSHSGRASTSTSGSTGEATPSAAPSWEEGTPPPSSSEFTGSPASSSPCGSMTPTEGTGSDH